MSGERSSLYETILHTMEPYSGAIVARAVVDRQCAELQVAPEAIGPQHLPELANRVAKGMSAFIGADMGERVGRLIRGLGQGS